MKSETIDLLSRHMLSYNRYIIIYKCHKPSIFRQTLYIFRKMFLCLQFTVMREMRNRIRIQGKLLSNAIYMVVTTRRNRELRDKNFSTEISQRHTRAIKRSKRSTCETMYGN